MEQASERTDWMPPQSDSDGRAALCVGLIWYHLIRSADELWSREVQGGSAEFDPEIARIVHKLYEWWIAPSSKIIKWLDGLPPGMLSHVNGSSEFRLADDKARSILSTNIEDIIKGMAQARCGEVIPLDAAE